MKLYIKNRVYSHYRSFVRCDHDLLDDQSVPLEKIALEMPVAATPLLLISGFSLNPTFTKSIRSLLVKIRHVLLTKGVEWISRPVGIRFLSKAETIDYLKAYHLVTHPENTVLLPEVVELSDPDKVFFTQTTAQTEPVRVWKYVSENTNTRLLPYGGLIVDNKVLCMDTNNDDFCRNILHLRQRKKFHAKTVITPWSHYLDGFIWGGYYDFLLLLIGKLCRIKDALPESVFREAIVAYPLFGTAYEREYLSLLGIEPERVKDTRTHQITFDQCLLSNIGHWFYPNAADIRLIRKYILAQVPVEGPLEYNRIYISRAGRRRILNENELIDLLKTYDFQIIEDKPRSVIEQVVMYRNAQWIIGPHGASFSNILWCRPGAHLLELFSATYSPNYFRYMAELLGLRYSAYRYGPMQEGNWSKGLEDNIYVDVAELKQCLNKFLKS